MTLKEHLPTWLGGAVKEQKSALAMNVHHSGMFHGNDSINQLRCELHSIATRGISDLFSYKAYDTAAPLATSVDLIAESLADINPIIYDKQLNEYDTDQDILKFVNNPGFGQDWRTFALDATVSYLLTRNSFINMLGPVERPPIAMTPFKPFWVMHELDETDGYIKTFHVSKSSSGRQLDFERDDLKSWRFMDQSQLNELVHIRGQSDDDNALGRSPIMALLLTILQNVAGSQHNASLLNNGARPSGAFIADGVLSDTQFARINDQIKEEKTGPNNAGTPLLLEGGGKWEEMSITNKDMDFISLLVFGKEDVFNRYKIPLGLVSPKAMTLDNYRTSVVSLFDLAVLPTMRVILDGLSRRLLPRFKLDPERYVLTFDPSSVNAAMIKTGEKVKLMSDINSFTTNELRSEFGFEPIEGGDVVLAPSSDIPIGSDQFTENQPNPESVDDREDAQKEFIDLATKGGMTKEYAEELWSHAR